MKRYMLIHPFVCALVIVSAFEEPWRLLYLQCIGAFALIFAPLIIKAWRDNK